MLKTAIVWVARKGLELWGMRVVRHVIVDELERLSKCSDNTIDDKIVKVVRAATLKEQDPGRFLR